MARMDVIFVSHYSIEKPDISFNYKLQFGYKNNKLYKVKDIDYDDNILYDVYLYDDINPDIFIKQFNDMEELNYGMIVDKLLIYDIIRDNKIVEKSKILKSNEVENEYKKYKNVFMNDFNKVFEKEDEKEEEKEEEKESVEQIAKQNDYLKDIKIYKRKIL